ncbi:MAG: hypothetical protein JO281_06835 [Pseudonocardiales bacterium]|nr:hypothetical protein [Pseudonocardiales bacterium]
MFRALDVDPQGKHAGVLTKVRPIHHQRHQVQPGQIRGWRWAGAVSVAATNRRDTTELKVAVAASVRVPTGSGPRR